MAKETGSAAARLSALIAEIEAEAYAQGKVNARMEFLAQLGATGAPAPRPRSRRNRRTSRTRPAREPRVGDGKRAPRGATRALVERVLRNRPGLNVREILDGADTDAERLVKLSSVRAELYNGRRERRYASKDGRWSLATFRSAEGDDASDTPASQEPDDAAGSPADASQSEVSPWPETDKAAGASDGDGPGEDVPPEEPGTDGSQNRIGMNW